jgi:hypothetical protein
MELDKHMLSQYIHLLMAFKEENKVPDNFEFHLIETSIGSFELMFFMSTNDHIYRTSLYSIKCVRLHTNNNGLTTITEPN